MEQPTIDLMAHVTHAGQSPAVYVTGDLYNILVTGEQSGGAYALVEAVVSPGGGPPPHVHSREAEAFYVLEGYVQFTVADRTIAAGPGTQLQVPRGVPHAFKNFSAASARMLIWVLPAGLEKFFLEIGSLVADKSLPTPPMTDEDVARLLALAPKYGLRILPPPGQA